MNIVVVVFLLSQPLQLAWPIHFQYNFIPIVWSSAFFLLPSCSIAEQPFWKVFNKSYSWQSFSVVWSNSRSKLCESNSVDRKINCKTYFVRLNLWHSLAKLVRFIIRVFANWKANLSLCRVPYTTSIYSFWKARSFRYALHSIWVNFSSQRVKFSQLKHNRGNTLCPNFSEKLVITPRKYQHHDYATRCNNKFDENLSFLRNQLNSIATPVNQLEFTGFSNLLQKFQWTFFVFFILCAQNVRWPLCQVMNRHEWLKSREEVSKFLKVKRTFAIDLTWKWCLPRQRNGLTHRWAPLHLAEFKAPWRHHPPIFW